MPVASVAGKPGGIKAQHRAHFSGAKPSHQSIEAWSCHGAARRAPKFIVNQFDVDESTAPRFLDQVVLSALALEVRLYLRLGRLTHIQHGLALEDRCRKQVSAHPPKPNRLERNVDLVGLRRGKPCFQREFSRHGHFVPPGRCANRHRSFAEIRVPGVIGANLSECSPKRAALRVPYLRRYRSQTSTPAVPLQCLVRLRHG